MSRACEDAMERRRDTNVPQALAISGEALGDYSFDLDENANDEGLVYGWCVRWIKDAPLSVYVSGTPGLLWSNIPGSRRAE